MAIGARRAFQLRARERGGKVAARAPTTRGSRTHVRDRGNVQCRTLWRLRVAEMQAPIQKSRPATRAQMRNAWSERAPAKNRIPGNATKMTSSANIYGANELRCESVTTASEARSLLVPKFEQYARSGSSSGLRLRDEEVDRGRWVEVLRRFGCVRLRRHVDHGVPRSGGRLPAVGRRGLRRDLGGWTYARQARHSRASPDRDRERSAEREAGNAVAAMG